MGLMGLVMAYSGGLWGLLPGLTKSTDHPSGVPAFDFGHSKLLHSQFLPRLVRLGLASCQIQLSCLGEGRHITKHCCYLRYLYGTIG